MDTRAPAAADAAPNLRFGRVSGSWLLVTVSLASVAAYVLAVASRIGYPYELQFFEGSTVEVSARVTRGLALYGPPTTEFTPWPYPPLYFLVTGELGKVTGINLATMRAVSFVASLVTLVLLVAIVRRASGSTIAGLVAAGLFAGTYRVSGAWFDAARVDSLFVALLLVAVFAGLVAKTWRGGLVTGALLALAFLTKQNALVVAVPMLAYLAMRRRPVGLAAAGTLAVAAISSVLIGDALTGGWYSPYVVGQLLGQGTAWGWLVGFWFVDLLLPFGIVLLALVWWWVGHGRRRPVVSEATAYLLACTAGLVLAAIAGRVHEGGYVNVAIPAHAAMSLLLGLVSAEIVHHPETTRRLVLSGALVLGLQLLVLVAWHPQITPTSQDRTAGDTFIARLRTLPAPVIIPSHPFYLRLAGLPTHASEIAIGDLLATRPGRARDALVGQLPWSLAGVNSVLLDAPADAELFGPELSRDFTLVSTSFVPAGVFRPVADVSTVPQLLYVRTTELTR